jgi:hypothetical protein
LTGGEWFAIFLLALGAGCQLEEMVDAYKERTEVMLRIAGITQIETPSRLWSWVKRKVGPKEEKA